MVVILLSLFAIAAGAILKFAVTAEVSGFDIQAAGVILMVIGFVGLCIGIVQAYREGGEDASRS